MPDNPNVPTVLARALDAKRAQDRLRAAMAQVSAEIKAAPPAAPASGGSL